MKIGIASDHRGYDLKSKLVQYLIKQGYIVEDIGTNSAISVDYPDFAFKLAEKVAKGDLNYGIAICKTGIGMSIACNKVNGIRCAKVSNLEETILCREHNDANILALSSMNFLKAKKIVVTFLNTPAKKDNKYINRNEKIKNYEEKKCL